MEVEGAEQEQAQGTGLQGSQWGNLPFSMEYVLSLNAVQNICGVASHLADLMPVESSVCVVPCGMPCVLQPVSKEKPYKQEALSIKW